MKYEAGTANEDALLCATENRKTSTAFIHNIVFSSKPDSNDVQRRASHNPSYSSYSTCFRMTTTDVSVFATEEPFRILAVLKANSDR